MKIKSAEHIQKVLGEPFAIDFSDYVRKIRSALIIVSVISISLVLGGLTISNDSSFLGIRFEGLNNELIFKVLFSVNTYLFLHFFWCSIDSFQEWLIRVTGTRVAHVTTARVAADGADYPNDPRQSTLYYWWKEEANKIGSLQEPVKIIDQKLHTWENKVKSALEGNDPNVSTVCMSIREVNDNIHKLIRALEKTDKTIQSQRIPASLSRFDSRYQIFLRSQNMRWLMIELGFPLILSVYALVLLWGK